MHDSSGNTPFLYAQYNKPFNYGKVFEYNGTTNQSLYYQQNQTEPNTARNYELDYSNPLIYPSNSSYRNLLEAKYQTEGNAIGKESALRMQRDKEKLIEEIKRQVQKEGLLLKENANRSPYRFEENKSEEGGVDDKGERNSDSHSVSLRRDFSIRSLKEEKSVPPYSLQENLNRKGSSCNDNQINELMKENQSLKRENEELKRENEQLRNEIKEFKSKEANKESPAIEMRQDKKNSEAEAEADEFKNFLLLENERLTKELKEIYPNRYPIHDTIHNVDSAIDQANKNEKKKKKHKKKKRAKSKKDTTATIQSEQPSRRGRAQENDAYSSHLRKLNEYDLDSPERVKTCFACLLGKNTFYRGYIPTHCSKDKCQFKATHKPRNKSKSKIRSKSKPSIKA